VTEVRRQIPVKDDRRSNLIVRSSTNRPAGCLLQRRKAERGLGRRSRLLDDCILPSSCDRRCRHEWIANALGRSTVRSDPVSPPAVLDVSVLAAVVELVGHDVRCRYFVLL
jgi:hypothetical protein